MVGRGVRWFCIIDSLHSARLKLTWLLLQNFVGFPIQRQVGLLKFEELGEFGMPVMKHCT